MASEHTMVLKKSFDKSLGFLVVLIFTKKDLISTLLWFYSCFLNTLIEKVTLKMFFQAFSRLSTKNEQAVRNLNLGHLNS